MNRNDREYWEERARRREEEAALEGAELTEKMFEEYQQAARRIRTKVKEFYSRYASEQGLSYEEAVRVMSRPEMQEWRGTLGDYMDAIQAAGDEAVKAKLQAELDALAYNSRITRLEALEGQINMEMNTLYSRGVAQMKERFGHLFTEGYYKKVYDLHQRAGFMREFAHVDTRMLEDVLTYPWSGADFSDRLWRNKQGLLFSTRELLARGVIDGASTTRLSKALADLMGQSYRNAERLIQTEAAHFHEEAVFRAYEAAHVEWYEFRARLNEKTCPVCGDMDGEHFRRKDRREGENAPPLHPRCHCTTVEWDPEEENDWLASGQPMPHRMTYEEWLAEQQKKHGGEEAFKRHQKMTQNAEADRRLYNGLSDMLGRDAPDSFADFQDLKYNRPDDWRLVKLDRQRRSALRNGKSPPLPFADRAKAAEEKFTRYLFNQDNALGYAKGRNFTKVLGYSSDNWKALQQDILRKAAQYPARMRRETKYGREYEQKMVLYGVNKRPANVTVGWMEKDGKVWMTSAYIEEV